MKFAGLFLFSLLLFAGFICLPVDAVETKSTKLLQGSINELVMLSSNAGITLDGDSLPATIKQVKLGSSAAYYGVAVNDKVLDATVQDNILKLSIARGDKKFTANLPVSKAAFIKMITSTNKSNLTKQLAAGAGTLATGTSTLAAKTSTLSVSRLSQANVITVNQFNQMISESRENLARFEETCQKASMLKGKAYPEPKFNDWRAMKDYDFIVMLDVSGSMKRHMPTEGLSQWDWCASQIYKFTQNLNSRFKKGITLIVFNHQYSVNKISSVYDLQNVINGQTPGGGTDIANPLLAAIQQKLKSGKPTMVVILSDGKQNSQISSEELMLCAMKALPGPHDLKITFLQIGEGHFSRFIEEMDEGLVPRGAPFDIVSARSFYDVRALGLEQSIIDALTAK